MQFKRARRKLYQYYVKKRNKWLKKRIPSNNSIQLNINNTFILPSGFGWSVIAIAMSLFVLGTNFQNNTILLLCYFLLALLLISVFHSFFYFTQHRINFNAIKPDFENRQFHLPIAINSTQEYKGGALHFSIAHTDELKASKTTQQCTVFMQTQHSSLTTKQASTNSIKLPLPKLSRGIHACPPVTVACTYGFGLFKCWTHLTPNLQIITYPSMKRSVLSLHKTTSATDSAQPSDSQYAISDNLQGIREYQITDPIHHVSWKHVAKGQGMLTKDFSENKGVSGWLRLADLAHLSDEEALQCLCYQIQQLDKDHVQFGLDLGPTQILPQQGLTHLSDCLLQLALFSRDSVSNLHARQTQ